MAILIVILLMLVSVTNSTRRTWMYTTAGIQQFRDAREAFESITRRLSQATLNTYWDYNNDSAPTSYLRQSDLRFLSGNATVGGAPILTTDTNAYTQAVFFQAPLGYVSTTDTANTNYSTLPGANLTRLLNTWGFFVEFASDNQIQLRPPFITAQMVPYRYRFRLMELMEPSDSLTIYQYTSGLNGTQPKNLTYTGHDWFLNPLALNPRPARALAENIVALVLLPKLSPADEVAGNPAGQYNDSSLAPNYTYDTTTSGTDPNLDPRNQLPPEVQVTMVAVDETSFNRLQGISTSPPPDIANVLTTGTAGSPLFTTVGDTVNPANAGYAQDLQTLGNALQKDHLTYRVFTSNVSIEAAKWSRDQKN
jgi:uncharacterized protein (TIGR02599 family)